MTESLIAKIAVGLRQVSADIFSTDTSADMQTWGDRINGYAAELEAHLAEPVHGTHVFDMIAEIEKGNVATTETLIHMVAGTVLAKLIEDEGGGRSNVSFSPADMDAMHRDYELETNRDGLITTIKLIPRDGKMQTHHIVDEPFISPEAFDSLMTQDEDTTDALPQAEKSVAKPYWFFNDGEVREGPMDKEMAQRMMAVTKSPLAHIENRMCGRAECPNSDMQGACPACHPV